MPRTLKLKLSEEVYETLMQRAAETDRSPETLAADWLTSTIQAAASDDPLESFIGAVESSVPDGADEHDRHLGTALSAKLNPKADA